MGRVVRFLIIYENIQSLKNNRIETIRNKQNIYVRCTWYDKHTYSTKNKFTCALKQ